MASSEGYDSQMSGRPDSAGKTFLLSSDENFDWNLYEVYFSSYSGIFKDGTECLTTDFSKIDESAEEKTARLKRLAIANARVVQGILQTGINGTDALAVISQHAQEDPDKNAFVLFQMIKARFTRTANDRAQALSKQLNGLSANFKEVFT